MRWGNIRKNGGGPGLGTVRETGAIAWREEERELEKEIAPGPGPTRGRNKRKVSVIETMRGGGRDQDHDHVTVTRKVKRGHEGIPPVNPIEEQTPTPSAPMTPLYSSPS